MLELLAQSRKSSDYADAHVVNTRPPDQQMMYCTTDKDGILYSMETHSLEYITIPV